MTRLPLPPAQAPSDRLPLVREGSVPVSGFSDELRNSPDVQRYRFDFSLRGGPESPVHVMFSESIAAAEVKTGDMKALRIHGVASVEEARDRWVLWWRAGIGKPGFVAPRRTGRTPLLAATRPAARP
jgi:hypothetical protein